MGTPRDAASHYVFALSVAVPYVVNSLIRVCIILF